MVAQVTHGYKLPKPDHVDDKLWVLPSKLPCSILNHPVSPTPKENMVYFFIWFLLSLLNTVKWNKVNSGHQFVQLKVVFSLKNFEKMNFLLLQPHCNSHYSHYLAKALLRVLYWLIFIAYFINHSPVLTIIPLYQVCYNEKVLEFWPRLSSSLWKPAKKNGYLPSWRGLWHDLNNSLTSS